ncbi:MAG: aminomethyltransferase family protein, partial [Myxococcales bacterium]|nr:aminomethyltransferase family protein [Myxococcales bacterium]
PAKIGDVELDITRTGFTGDLGYEVWVPREHALAVWDAIMHAGRDYRVIPAGLDALDMTRVEAGFIMNGVDYFSAHHCLIESRKSTPYELGLGWTVALDREPFAGQAALRAEVRRGPAWSLVGLRYDWDEFEALFARYGLPPQVPVGAWRDGRPVYASSGRQVGQATSGAWSPQLKANLALASVRASHAAVGTRLQIEVTVEYERHRVTATVEPTPFFDPERKRKP